MPINVDPKDIVAPTTEPFEPEKPDTNPDVSIGEQLGGGLLIDNLTFAGADFFLDGEEVAVDPDFNLADNLTDEELADPSYHYVGSRAELEHKRKRHEQEREARRVMREGPLNEFLVTAIATLTDPTTYLPIFGQAKTGATVGRTALRVGARAAGENLAQEAALYGIQEDRTVQEMLMAGIFGAALGGGAGALGAKLAGVGKTGEDVFQKEIKNAVDYATSEATGFGGSVGAARAIGGTASAADTAVVGQPLLHAIGKGLSKIGMAAPALELGASRFASVRDAANRIFDTGIMTRGEKAGRDFGVESLDVVIRGQRDAMNNFVHTTFRSKYFEAKKVDGKLTAKEFGEQVAKAMRRGDEHTNPIVKEVAQQMRKEIYDPWADALVELGFFKKTEGPKGAISYFPRVLSRDALHGAGRERFVQRVSKWMRQEWEATGRKGTQGVNKADLADLTDKELDELFRDGARQAMDKQLNTNRGRIAQIMTTERGPLKGRTWDIPDEVIEDFLDNDFLRVTSRYLNTVTADGNIKNAGYKDVATPKELLETIDDEILARIDEVIEKAGGDADKLPKKAKKAIEKIRAEGDRERAMIQTLWDRLRGMDGVTDKGDMGVQAMAMARTFNYVKSLGSVTLSSLPDPWRMVMTEGMARTSGLLIKDLVTGLKGVRASRKTLQHMGNALDLRNSQRMAHLVDVLDPHTMDQSMSIGLNKMSQKFSLATLLPMWNDMWKSMTSFVVMNRILDSGETLAKGGRLSKRDATRLAQSRLSPEDAVAIYNDLAGRFEKNNGSWVVHMDELPKTSSARRFQSAVNRDVDNTIITPGLGDAPIWTGKEWGKTIFQFKKFGMSATQRIMIAGLQAGLGQRDISVLLGATLMAATGAASIALKDKVAGRDVKDRSTSQWVAEGIDRSGLMGIYFDLEGIAGTFTAGTTPSSLLTGAEPSRYAGRNRLGRVLGPTAGTFQQAGELSYNAISHLRDHGEITNKDVHRATRMTPFLNLFYLQYLTKMVEEQIGETFGLQDDIK